MDENKFNYLLANLRKEKCCETLYKYFYPKIIKHTYIKFGIGNICEDVAQEFFTKLSTMEVKSFIIYPTSWVYKISDNIAYDMIKKEKKYDLAYVELSEVQYEDVALNGIIFGEYKEKLKKFDAKTRDIVLMKSYEGYSFKEISARLGMKYCTVRRKFYKAKKELQKE